MIAALADFADELRAGGIPVSMVEVLDAAEAMRHVDLADRGALRASLSATLVKSDRHQPVFDSSFDVFFGSMPRPPRDDDAAVTEAAMSGEAQDAFTPDDLADLAEALAAALRSGDEDRLRTLVQRAVAEHSGFRPGRPVGGSYYLHRVMSRLDADAVAARLIQAATSAGSGDVLDEHLAEVDAASHIAELRRRVEEEILRRLVADRGAHAVARTLRRPLIDDIDLMHATGEELGEISRRVTPLARRLATRLSARRRRGRRGRLDVRRTIRRSLAHGGALVDPRWRPRRISKPELVLLCDVSGSMATFARFTMQLTYAIGHQFSNVRAFAFVDGVDEVTRFLGPASDFAEALNRIAAEADVVHGDGHSDYGTALRRFQALYPDAVTSRSTVIVTGDARNNYRQSGVEVLAAIAEEARALHWLNPESHRYWNTGDSIMATYAGLCDDVHEVRTLRQLEQFVERVAVSGRSARAPH